MSRKRTYRKGAYWKTSRKYKNRRAAHRKSGASEAGPVRIIQADGTERVEQPYNMHEYARVLAGGRPGRTPLEKAMIWGIYRRDGGRCRYCGVECGEGGERWEIDHVVPVAKGGRDAEDNLVLACRRCNQKKGTDSWVPNPL
jgi:5-methylcytosine-specific restriction endonuclease McrA